MISPDSTSYPCLVVIEHHGLQTKAAEVYSAGRLLLSAFDEARRYRSEVIVPRRPDWMAPVAFAHLVQNYRRAATQFGWL